MIQKTSDFKTSLFIDGSYVEATGGRLATLNPATNDILAEVAAGRATDIDRALQAAFDQLRQLQPVPLTALTETRLFTYF